MSTVLPNSEECRLIREQFHPKQAVLVCFPDEDLTNWAVGLLKDAGCIPVVFGEDLRWKAMIAQAFANRTAAVIGDPMLVLGLSKLSRACGMPLKIRSAVLVGRAWGKWLTEGVSMGLDCNIIPVVLEEDGRSDDLRSLEEHLLSWTSVLDCRLRKGLFGLEMEIITFEGEKIPKIPSCAKLVMRSWSPEGDIPMILTENH